MGFTNMKRCSDNLMVVSKVGAGVVVEMEFRRSKEGSK
jgi:hypothetical protein